MKLKKLLITRLLIILFFIIPCATFAQIELWGVAGSGGLNGSGVIFKTETTTNSQTVPFSFHSAIEGSGSLTLKLLAGNNGLLYGMSFTGGTSNKGIIFKYNPTTNVYSKTLDFGGASNGRNPKGSLIQVVDGTIYGMTNLGGVNDLGVIFQYNATTDVYTKKVDLNSTNGTLPEGDLMQASDGMLYGMTSKGGLYNKGVLFQYNPNTSIYTKKIDFDGLNKGSIPTGSLMQANDGLLYGMTGSGGVNDKGVLFRFDPSTGTYIKILDFGSVYTGVQPYGSLIQASNGMLYGMTLTGGVNGIGVLFQYDPINNIYTHKLDFDGTNTGKNPYGSLIKAADGMLYAITRYGGSQDAGVIFQYNTTNSTFTKKVDLKTSGGYSFGTLTQASNGMLYGMNASDLTSSAGIIFQYNYTTNIYTEKVFTGSNSTGAEPQNSLIKANDGKIYGMTTSGGTLAQGVLFQFDPVSNIFSSKINFDGINKGSNPTGTLMQASDGMLYGVTSHGGAATTSPEGVLFQYNPNTNALTKKVDFSALTTTGRLPCGKLIEANDGMLYGMTSQGGADDNGVIYQYNPITSTYTKKIEFSRDNNGGSLPYGSLMLASDGMLYGLTSGGGSNYGGILFQYNPATNVLTKKVDFPLGGPNGYSPNGSLIQVSNSLYGLNLSGGSNYEGVLFEYNLTTGICSKKINFGGTIGRYPYGSLTLASDGFLYGMTYNGGTNNKGVMFQYNLATNTCINKFNFNGANGQYSTSQLLEINPTTRIQSNQCGASLIGICDNIFAYTVSSALGYRFKITNGTQIEYIDTIIPSFQLTQLATLPLPNSVINIEVAVKFTGGIVGAYGTQCSVTVPNNITPAPTGSGTQTLCNPATIASISLTGLSINWYTTANGGSVLPTNTSLINGVTYYASQTVCGNESVTRFPVTITINAPAAPTGSATQNFCSTSTVANLVATGTDVKWYLSNIGGAVLTNQTLLTNGTIYYASQTIAGCESVNRFAVTVTNNILSNTVTQNLGQLTANQSGATYQWYECPNTLLNGQTNQSFTPTNGHYYKVVITKGGCTVTSDCITVISLKLFIEGYYNVITNKMIPVKANQGIGNSTTYVDDITVELRNTTGVLVSSALSQLQTDGTAMVAYTISSGSYYIVVKHRNGLETWSATSQTLGSSPLNYDFTTAANRAYGNNQKTLNTGVFGIYSGDINQDGFIDSLDITPITNDSASFVDGYVATDINGDGVVDSLDLPNVLNNADKFVEAFKPFAKSKK